MRSSCRDYPLRSEDAGLLLDRDTGSRISSHTASTMSAHSLHPHEISLQFLDHKQKCNHMLRLSNTSVHTRDIAYHRLTSN